MISITRQVCPTTAMYHIVTSEYISLETKVLALGPRFGVFLGPQNRLLQFPGVGLWTIFEFLGGRVIDISHHIDTI